MRAPSAGFGPNARCLRNVVRLLSVPGRPPGAPASVPCRRAAVPPGHRSAPSAPVGPECAGYCPQMRGGLDDNGRTRRAERIVRAAVSDFRERVTPGRVRLRV